MGQEGQFQFQTAPQKFYTTSYESEVAYVTPGGHQSTDFSEFQISQEYKKQIVFQKGMPIGEGLGFLASLVILWQTVKVIQKRTRKILPLVIFVLFVGNLSARDVVWKYSFMDQTFTETTRRTFQSITLGGRKVKMGNTVVTYNGSTGKWDVSHQAKCSFFRSRGMWIKPKSNNFASVDFINEDNYDTIRTIKLNYSYNANPPGLKIFVYLQEYSGAYNSTGDKNKNNREKYVRTDPICKDSISDEDGTLTLNINRPMSFGWILHFEVNDTFCLRSIEIEYVDNASNPDVNKPCYKFYSNGELTHQFVDHLGNVDYLTNGHLVSEAMEDGNWTFAGWSSANDYYDADTCEPITDLASGTAATDIEYHAIYNHRRPKENPVDPDSASRYYSLYSDVCPVMDENGYEVSNDVTFPDGVRYKMSIDNTRFYYFSLPYDCPYSYIKFSNESIDEYVSGVNEDNTAYIGEWLITRWDESGFEWHDMSLEELQQNGLVAGVGYGIGIVPDVNTDVYFHSDYYQKVCPLHNDTIPISFTYPVKDNITGYHSGWNFLGSRFFQAIDYAATNTNYVLEPDSASTGWILHSKYKEPAADKFTIAPFSAYMVQTNMDMVYNLNNLQAVAAVCSENHFNLAIRQEGDANRMDYSTIVANPNYTDKYEIGMDMGKMLVQDYLPQIYSVMDSSYYAINASGFGIGSKIKVGIYVPHKENWVVSLGKNIEIPEGWHIILKDKSTGEKKDLTVEEYQFNLKKGLYPNRFEVEISDMPLDVEDVSIKGDCEPTWMRIVSISGIVAYEGEFDLDRLDGLTEGIYVVQTDVWVKKMLVR